MQVDILNLEWSSRRDRDRDAATLVCNYLRYQGLSIHEGSMFNSYFLINKLKPKILLMTNTTGATLNQNVARYAKNKKIKVVSLISEGNIKESDLDSFIWGHNREKISFEDLNMLWSNKCYDVILKKFPQLKQSLKISGSVGHDKYLIEKPHKNNNKTKKIIGVGCWGFNFYLEDNTTKNLSSHVINFFLEQRSKFNTILSSIIKLNQDCLFIIKEHPANTLGYVGSGIESCVDFPNVKIYKYDRSIVSCIYESDLWISYDSTTAMEAWLSNKQTCFLNPDKEEWPTPRDNIHTAQPIYGSLNELQCNIERIKKGEYIEGFLELKKKREEVIKEIITYNDGLNHVRAGNEIIKLFNSNSKLLPLDPSLKIPTLRDVFHQRFSWLKSNHFSFFNRSKLKKEDRFFWKQEEVNDLSLYFHNLQINLYKRLRLDKKKLLELECVVT